MVASSCACFAETQTQCRSLARFNLAAVTNTGKAVILLEYGLFAECWGAALSRTVGNGTPRCPRTCSAPTCVARPTQPARSGKQRELKTHCQTIWQCRTGAPLRKKERPAKQRPCKATTALASCRACVRTMFRHPPPGQTILRSESLASRLPEAAATTAVLQIRPPPPPPHPPVPDPQANRPQPPRLRPPHLLCCGLLSPLLIRLLAAAVGRALQRPGGLLCPVMRWARGGEGMRGKGSGNNRTRLGVPGMTTVGWGRGGGRGKRGAPCGPAQWHCAPRALASHACWIRVDPIITGIPTTTILALPLLCPAESRRAAINNSTSAPFWRPRGRPPSG